MSKTESQLRAAQMPHLADYYVYLESCTAKLIETGSSSIGPAFADCCTQVRNHMKTRHRVTQKNEHLNAAWAALGDTSGIFYFGGNLWDEAGNHHEWIDVVMFIELMSNTIHELPESVRLRFDELCGALLASQVRVMQQAQTIH